MDFEIWLLYGEWEDGCCMVRGEMVVVWLEGRWLLYGERGDGYCMERGEMVVVWREGRWLLYG